jgi:HPt (histidine-containing phosphotransfer) domain-containing protein
MGKIIFLIACGGLGAALAQVSGGVFRGEVREFGRPAPSDSQASPRTMVAVPAGLEQIAPGYLARRRLEATQMTSLLAAADYEALRILGHDLKGSGSSYGFPELTQFGIELESAAKGSDHENLAVSIIRLASYLSRVQLDCG